MNEEPDMFAQVGNVAQVSIIERWQWYHRALADPALINGKTLLVHPGEFELGYYRMRTKGGQWIPVAIFPNDDGVVGAQVGDLPWNPNFDLPNLFQRCCRFPISYEAFVKAIEGGGFDDEPPAPTIGDNSDGADPLEALRIEYLGEKEQAAECLKKPITTQAEADRAAIWAKRLGDIAKRATDMHKVEKQPSLDESRRIDDKYRELKEEPAVISRNLKRHQDAFLNEQRRLEEERQRKARAEADRIQREAAQAARDAEVAAATVSDEDAQKKQAEAARLAEQASAAEREAQARTVSAGRTGARTSLRTFKVAKVTDYDALLMALKDEPEIREAVLRIANRIAKVTPSSPLPGMEIVTEQRTV